MLYVLLVNRCLSAHFGSGTPMDASAGASAYATLSTRSKVAFVVDLFLELCKLHDRAAYTFQYLSDPTVTTSAELELCLLWVQDQAAQGRCLTLPSKAAAAAQSSTAGWEQEQHAQQAVFEAAGRLFAAELAAMSCVRLAELPLLARQLLVQHPDVLEKVRRRWEYLLVDELQVGSYIWCLDRSARGRHGAQHLGSHKL